MKDGYIGEMGSYADLMNANGEFCQLMNSYGGTPGESENKSELADVVKPKIKSDYPQPSVVNEKHELIKAENKMTGNINSKVFSSFVIAMGGYKFGILIVFCLLLTQVLFIYLFLFLHGILNETI